MSRSRKKVAVAHVCTGSNTEFYKDARKHLRTMMKQEMQRLKGKDPEQIDEEVMGFQNKHDPSYNDWNEPTDGTYVATKGEFFTEEDIKKLKRK